LKILVYDIPRQHVAGLRIEEHRGAGVSRRRILLLNDPSSIFERAGEPS
jgi:hypothetical protein